MVKPLLIQTKAKWHEVLQDTFAMTEQFERADPSWELVKRIRQQLEFMKSRVAGDRNPTADEATRVNVGPIAAKNFEDTQPQYAEWLMELDYAFHNWKNLG